MILIDRAMSTRINWFLAQILRVFETATVMPFLKVFFSDNRLISAAKCRDSSQLMRVEIG